MAVNTARVLLIDVETSPLVAYAWGPMWETNLIEVINQSRILSFSAKWLGGKQITKGWDDYKMKKGHAETALLLDLHGLLSEADVVIAHNGNAFDTKIINARFLATGLGPPTPFQVMDTKLIVKRYFRLPSNSLDNICGYFGLGKKMEHEGFALWKKCLDGDKKAWARMKKYNAHDVTLLEELYLLVRPWITNHPNMGALAGTPNCCPKCSVVGKLHRRGWNVRKTSRTSRFQCRACGGWSSGKSEKIEDIEIR